MTSTITQEHQQSQRLKKITNSRTSTISITMSSQHLNNISTIAIPSKILSISRTIKTESSSSSRLVPTVPVPDLTC